MREPMQIGISCLGGWIGWWLGGYDGFLYALVTFMVVDYMTGVLVAITERNVCSEVGFRGIAKKMLILALVGIGHILDSQVIGNGSSVRTAVIFFYASNEAISILENASRVGLPIPKKLARVLASLRERD